MSIALNIMSKWLSVRHLTSLVGRYENIEVKATNKYLQYLRAIVHDDLNDQIKLKWGSSSVYNVTIKLYINSFDHDDNKEN